MRQASGASLGTVRADLEKDPHATKVLRKLVEYGCSREDLLVLVAKCVLPTPKEILLRKRRSLQSQIRNVKLLAQRMKELATSIRQATAPGTPREGIIALDRKLPSILEKNADALLNKTIPDLKWASTLWLNDYFTLGDLCQYVKLSTGQQHYPEIADLLTIANGIVGNEETAQPDTISRKMRRLNHKLGPFLVTLLYQGVEASLKVSADIKRAERAKTSVHGLPNSLR